MRRAVATALMVSGLTWLCGCGIFGRWVLHHLEPESATEHFTLAEVTLNDDGSYTAMSKYGDEVKESSGKYTFEGGALTFTPSNNGSHQRTYEAELTDLGRRLKVRSEREGAPVVAVMKRE